MDSVNYGCVAKTDRGLVKVQMYLLPHVQLALFINSK